MAIRAVVFSGRFGIVVGFCPVSPTSSNRERPNIERGEVQLKRIRHTPPAPIPSS